MPFDIEPSEDRPERPTDPIFLAFAAALGRYPTEEELAYFLGALERELDNAFA